MGHQDGGQTEPQVKRPQHGAQFNPDRWIEGAERFVQQQHLRLDSQRPRQRHTLALAAGKLMGIAPAQAIELHHGEQFVDALADRGGRWAAGARTHPQPEANIVGGSHVAEQRVILKHKTDAALACRYRRHIDAINSDDAIIVAFQPGDQAQQTGLARPGRPDKGDKFASGDVE